MILRPTTIVLGAGASRPYGFHTGNELNANLKGAVSRLNSDRQDILRRVIESLSYVQFSDRLSGSSAESIDRFLHFNRDLIDIGRRLVAFELLANRTLPVQGNTNKWYGYLFQRMADGCINPEMFAHNNVKVITFNYDLSFEWELFKFVSSYFNIDRKEAIGLASVIHVMHPHGSLGLLPRQADSDFDYFSTPDAPSIVEWSSNIRFVRDTKEDNEQILHHLRGTLKESKNVFFLGFGFHDENMRKIFYPVGHGDDRYNNESQVNIVASTFGQYPGEVRHWCKQFSSPGKITTHNADILDTLRESKDILMFYSPED